MEITPEVIASLIGGRVEGNKECTIKGFAKIEEAHEGDLSFIANPKYSHYASTTQASALIVGEDFKTPEKIETTLIRVADPYSSLATLMQQFSIQDDKSGIEENVHISATAKIGKDVYIGAFAYIGENAVIGDKVKIYPHSYIGDKAEIGEGTKVYPHVTVYPDCKIGKRCILHSGSVIGADGFGFAPSNGEYKKIPQIGIVEIEDDVEIGANTTIDRATMGETRIGKGTKLDNLIQVAHNVRIGRNNVIAAQTGIAGSSIVGDSNRIGGQVGIAGHIKIGNHCEIGAQSGLNKGYRSFSRVIGYPAVDIATFAKSTILIRRLPELFKEFEELKAEINKNNIK